MKQKTIIYFTILFTIIFNAIPSLSFSSIPIWNDTLLTNSDPKDLNFLSLESESAILIEQTTGQILYEKNSNVN